MFSTTKKILEEFDNQHDFERMCADILNASGCRDVVLVAPRGGSDGGRDITFSFGSGLKGLACVTLRKDIDNKFKEDFSQRQPGEYDKYYLFCNVYLSSPQKSKYFQYCLDNLQADFVPQDIEALRSLLDSSLKEVRKTHLEKYYEPSVPREGFSVDPSSLQELLDELPTIKTLDYYHPVFQAWHSTVKQSLRQIFSENSHQVTEYAKIAWRTSDKPEDEDEQHKLFLRSCNAAEGLLKGIIRTDQLSKANDSSSLHNLSSRTEFDNQLEIELQGYLDRIQELLLEKNLRESKPGDEVRNVARMQTLAIMRKLDGDKKGFILQHLYELGLINNPAIVDLRDVDLSGANLDSFSLSDANLQGVDLSGAFLRWTDLERANLRNAILIEATMWATLRKANLRGAIMHRANLRGADLQEADLGWAELYGANLTEANLVGANLSGVDLSETNLSKTNLEKAKYNRYTRQPEGYDMVIAGAVPSEEDYMGP